jgi:hypothetical protein
MKQRFLVKHHRILSAVVEPETLKVTKRYVLIKGRRYVPEISTGFIAQLEEIKMLIFLQGTFVQRQGPC